MQIAAATVVAVLLAAVCAPVLAVLCGIRVDIAPFSALGWLALTLLLAATFRHYWIRGEQRLALAVGGVLAIEVSGAAGGVISITGQAFARPLIDPLLANADRAMGLSAIGVTKVVASIDLLPDFLAVAYVSSIPLILISVVVLGALGRAERMWELCASFSVCMLIATVSSAVIPAVGAFPYFAIAPDIQAALPVGSGVYHLPVMMELRQAGAVQLDAAHLQGLVTFPSFHTAMALMTAAAWRDDRRVRGPMLVWNAIVIASTIPIGGHYFVDLAAAAIMWLAWSQVAGRLAAQPNSKFTGKPVPLTA